MNQCCENWLRNLTPLRPQRGRFVEVRSCPTCKKKYRVTFEAIDTLGNPTEYVVVAADPA